MYTVHLNYPFCTSQKNDIHSCFTAQYEYVFRSEIMISYLNKKS